MKKILLLLVFAALLFSCQKEKNEPVAGEQEVSFSATLVQPDLKNSEDFLPCKTEPATHAHMIIDGNPYDVQVFTIGTKLYTQAIKLAPGNKTLTEFFLYNEANGTPGYQNTTPADIIVYSTPADGSPYEVYLNPSWDLPYTFEVLAFQKIEINIEVLCFVDLLYQNFGFFWFEITEIIIREACFFGDVCLNGLPYAPADFTGSLYAQNGLEEDEIAFFKVYIYKNGVPVPNSPYSNETTYGNSLPLCVEYPDNLNLTGEVFTFEIWVLVKVGNIFLYQYFGTLTSTDDGPIYYGTLQMPDDAVIDFAVGTCSPMSTIVFDWPATYNVTVRAGDLATGFTDPELLNKWFFYNDETDQIDNTLGSFVAGPGTPPAGNGSAKITVNGTQRRNLATYQFFGTPLNQITTLAFSTYNASATNYSGPNSCGYLNFNVDFDGTDTWQKRLVYVPADNGAVIADTWQEWNTVTPGSLWRWSGAIGGGTWPDGVVASTRTWSDILAAFPNARVRVSDPWMGIRVGEPYPAGYTENLDLFRFQAGGPLIVYNFEN